MKKSRVISVITALFLLVSLSACSINNSSSAIESTTTVEETVITTEQTTEATTELVTEPRENSIEDIQAMVAQMSLEEKVGQMFIATFPDEGAADSAAQYHLGGYTMFGKDFDGKTSDEVKAAIGSVQAAAKIPMLIAVDEEGGTVVRVSSNPNLYPEPFPAPKEYKKENYTDTIETIKKTEGDKADLLLSLGINVNLAPVCDITTDEDAFMYERSYADNAKDVSDFVAVTTEVYKNKKLGSVLKHFPGYGDNADTHTGSAVDDRSYAQLANNDFLPFEAGVIEGAGAIMVSHNTLTKIDPDCPASLSDIVHQIIRSDLNFKGVIMTDDLSMAAITDFAGDNSPAVLAVKGGNDLICCTDFAGGYQAVIDAVNNGEIPVEQIDQSVTRILKWKQDLGLLDN